MFHVKEGLYFERMAYGKVHIMKRSTVHPESPIEMDMILEDSDWASIVASVSARNETGETYREAMEFHHRD
jgi:hypothetical protein